MKTRKNVLASIALVLFGLTISVSPAIADGETIYCHGDNICSTTPPKPTDFGAFAVVDSTGNVVGVIAGDIRDLGTNDKTTNTYAGCSSGCNLILQKTADPVTGNSAGWSSSGTTQVTHNPSENTFTVKQDNVVVEKMSVPEVTHVNDRTVITSLDVTFTAETSTASTGSTVDLSEKSTTDLNVAVITASEVVTDNTNIFVKTENLVIESKVTEQEAVSIINNSSNRVMKSKIDRLIKLLGDWLL